MHFAGCLYMYVLILGNTWESFEYHRFLCHIRCYSFVNSWLYVIVHHLFSLSRACVWKHGQICGAGSVCRHLSQWGEAARGNGECQSLGQPCWSHSSSLRSSVQEGTGEQWGPICWPSAVNVLGSTFFPCENCSWSQQSFRSSITLGAFSIMPATFTHFYKVVTGIEHMWLVVSWLLV